jgi:hypothetical protein
MSYVATATASLASTMTEARVRIVMYKVSANFTALVVAGHVTSQSARKWAEDLTYLQVAEALLYFELQIRPPGGRQFGLRYTVSADGSVQQDSSSGGIDWHGIPVGTSVGLYAHLCDGIPGSVREELGRRGWGFDGKRLDAPESEARAFSASGYGLTRAKLGVWP